MGENNFAELPVALYGVSMLIPAIAYFVLQGHIVRANGPDHRLAEVLGRDINGKISFVICVAGVGLAFVNHWLLCLAYVLLAEHRLIPDRRKLRSDMNAGVVTNWQSAWNVCLTSRRALDPRQGLNDTLDACACDIVGAEFDCQVAAFRPDHLAADSAAGLGEIEGYVRASRDTLAAGQRYAARGNVPDRGSYDLLPSEMQRRTDIAGVDPLKAPPLSGIIAYRLQEPVDLRA